jgi:hypothetical protein
MAGDGEAGKVFGGMHLAISGVRPRCMPTTDAAISSVLLTNRVEKKNSMHRYGLGRRTNGHVGS